MVNESGADDANMQSWPYYAEAFFAATAIMDGKVDMGMDMEERFAHAVEVSGRLDLSLSWDGPDKVGLCGAAGI